MDTVHFRIGSEMGIRLMEIAQEQLLYELNPKKAISVFTDSFGDECPMEIKLDLLISKKIILVDEEDQMFDVVDIEDYPHLRDMYPSVNLEEWVNRKQKEIGDRGKELHTWLGDLLRKFKTGTFSRTKVNVYFPIESIIEFAQGDQKSVLNDLLDNPEIRSIYDLIASTRKYLEETVKLEGIFSWMHVCYPNIYIDTGHAAIIDMVFFRLSNLIRNTSFEDKELNELDNFIQSQIENTKIITKGIKPVDIMDNYSAGWLSPDGKTYYGLNGEIANMLHNQLADAMLEADIIPKNKVQNNPDSWLLQNGWIKQCGNWILYEGYMNHCTGKEDVPITKEQINTIYKFGQICCKGVLRLGLQQKQITAARFEMTDPLQFKLNWFNL